MVRDVGRRRQDIGDDVHAIAGDDEDAAEAIPKFVVALGPFFCRLEKHKFNKHGLRHHSVKIVKLKY